MVNLFVRYSVYSCFDYTKLSYVFLAIIYFDLYLMNFIRNTYINGSTVYTLRLL